jgi:hypothetical protein
MSLPPFLYALAKCASEQSFKVQYLEIVDDKPVFDPEQGVNLLQDAGPRSAEVSEPHHLKNKLGLIIVNWN